MIEKAEDLNYAPDSAYKQWSMLSLTEIYITLAHSNIITNIMQSKKQSSRNSIF